MRQSALSVITYALQFPDFLDEIRGFLKTSVHTGIAYIRHLVNLPQLSHDEFANRFAGHFPLVLIGDFQHNALHQVLDHLGTYRSFLAGFLYAGYEFVLGKILPPVVSLEHNQPYTFNFFVGREPVLAPEAFPASANGRSFTRSARINHLVILTTTLGAAHKETTNCGCLFVSRNTL
jgi:hypothetical protein